MVVAPVWEQTISLSVSTETVRVVAQFAAVFTWPAPVADPHESRNRRFASAKSPWTDAWAPQAVVLLGVLFGGNAG